MAVGALPIDPVQKAADALLLDAALQAIPYGFCVWSPQLRIVLFNQKYVEIYGFSAGQVYKGMELEELVRLACARGHHPGEAPEAVYAEMKLELLANRGGSRAKSRELVAGSQWIETTHAYSPGLGWMVTHEDVTEEVNTLDDLQRRGDALELQHRRLQTTVNNISQGLSLYNGSGRLLISNPRYQSIYGLPDAMVQPGIHIDDILNYLFDRGMTTDTGRDDYFRWRREMIAGAKNGKAIHHLDGQSILMQHHPMDDGGWVTTHEDITEQRLHEERIRHIARHDALTQLPNRTQFLERMTEAEIGIARGEHLAVLMIDLDHFKAINDTVGHTFGDKLLQRVAARLAGVTREEDILARLGGDEFALLLRGVTTPADVATIAERIVKTMTGPFSIEGQQVAIGCSIGIVLAPQDGSSTEQLLKNADLALYRAKTDGRATYHFFEPGMDAAIQRRRSIEAGLRLALERGEFRLVFQPLIGLNDNRITGLEALLRWESPERGPISPAEFIPVAEETGIIVEIGDWVLREACLTAAAWPDDVSIAVNLSAAQFRNRRLFETVEAVLAETGLKATRLELEITETLLLAENDQTLETLHRLRQIGVRISMDDFGTGYSSLSYLRSFPFDKIKIDRSFIRDLKSKNDSLAIIKAVIGLAHSLGMSTTAEGIETEEQFSALRDQGCDQVQGFLFSPPVAPQTISQMLVEPILPPIRRAS